MNKDFKIEHGIEMPRRKSSSGFTEALREMKVGDSLVLSKDAITRCGVYSSARALRMRVAVRAINDKQCRIWRVE